MFSCQRIIFIVVFAIRFSCAVPNILVAYNDGDHARELEASLADISAALGGSLSMTVLTSEVNASMDKALTEISKALENGVTVFIGCLGSSIDKYIIHLAELNSIPFICVEELGNAEASRLAGHTYISMGNSLASATNTIHGIAEQTAVTDVVLIGTSAQIGYTLPSLRMKKSTRERECHPLDVNDADVTLTLSKKSYTKLLIVVLSSSGKKTINAVKAINRRYLRPSQIWLFFRDVKQEEDVVLTNKVVLSAKPLRHVAGVLWDAMMLVWTITFKANRATSWSYNLYNIRSFNSQGMNTTLYRRILSSPIESPQFDSAGQQIDSKFSLTRQRNGTTTYIGYIKGGTLSEVTDMHLMDPSRKCRNPKAICVIATHYPPVVAWTKFQVKSSKECPLSQVCTRHIKTTDESDVTTTRYEHYCCFGYAVDILIALQRDLEMEAEIFVTDEELYGIYNESQGQWRGLITELIDGKADMLLGPMSTTYHRSKVVDISPVALILYTCVLVMMEKDATTHTDLFGFTEPFDNALWAAYLGGSLLFVVIIWLMDRYRRRDRGLAIKRPFHMSESFSYLSTAVFKIQVDDATAVTPGARFTYAAFSFATLVLVSAYTANLTANLVEVDFHFPVSGIYDKKLQDPNFRLGVTAATSTEARLRGSKNDTLRKLAEKAIYLKSFMLKDLEMGRLDAVLSYTPMIQVYNTNNPKLALRIVGEPLNTESGTFAFPKNSPWIEKITMQLLKYQEMEYFSILSDKWFYRRSKQNNKKTTVNRLGIENLEGLFVVVLTSIVGCGFVVRYRKSLV